MIFGQAWWFTPLTLSTGEAETDESLWFLDSQGCYTLKPRLKKPRRKKKNFTLTFKVGINCNIFQQDMSHKYATILCPHVHLCSHALSPFQLLPIPPS